MEYENFAIPNFAKWQVVQKPYWSYQITSFIITLYTGITQYEYIFTKKTHIIHSHLLVKGNYVLS